MKYTFHIVDVFSRHRSAVINSRFCLTRRALVRLIRVLARVEIYHNRKKKMIKTITLSMCLAASSLSLNARAQDTLTRDALAQNDRQYTDGPVTEVDYIQVEYGHFAEYIDWLNSTWKPTMEAMKKAGIIIDYKVFQASSKITGSAQYVFISHF